MVRRDSVVSPMLGARGPLAFHSCHGHSVAQSDSVTGILNHLKTSDHLHMFDNDRVADFILSLT